MWLPFLREVRKNEPHRSFPIFVGPPPEPQPSAIRSLSLVLVSQSELLILFLAIDTVLRLSKCWMAADILQKGTLASVLWMRYMQRNCAKRAGLKGSQHKELGRFVGHWGISRTRTQPCLRKVILHFWGPTSCGGCQHLQIVIGWPYDNG